ncbi:MAG: hypothetical protein OXF02_06605 [Simkaniaceae bacterium]|nr:hypothetical protein [Simkaniaceae bacterium]
MTESAGRIGVLSKIDEKPGRLRDSLKEIGGGKTYTNEREKVHKILTDRTEVRTGLRRALLLPDMSDCKRRGEGR